MIFQYETEVIIPFDHNFPDVMKGHVVADTPMDAYYLIEDKYSLKLDIDKFGLSVSIYQDDELVVIDGFEPEEHARIKEKIKHESK